MAKILKPSLEGEQRFLTRPVNTIRISLSDIPRVLFPRREFPKSPIRDNSLGSKMGTAVHDHLEMEIARRENLPVRAVFPTLPERRTLEMEKRLQGVEIEKPPLLEGEIAERERRERADINNHAEGIINKFGAKFFAERPASGDLTLETSLHLNLGHCQDGLQVEVAIVPDIVITTTPGRNPMVVIQDIKNFPLPKHHEDGEFDIHLFERQLTMAAFSWIADHKLTRRAQQNQPQEDYLRPFRDSDWRIVKAIKEANKYGRTPVVFHQEVHLSYPKGYQSDTITMYGDDIINFLKSAPVRRLVAQTKREWKALQRNKKDYERPEGSKTRFVPVTDAVLKPR